MSATISVNYQPKQREKISDAVIAAAINLGADNITDYLHELSYDKEGSFFEELDEDNLRVRFLLTVQASVACSVLTRLGYTADDYIGREMFEWMHVFNTSATVNIFGTTTSIEYGFSAKQNETIEDLWSEEYAEL